MQHPRVTHRARCCGCSVREHLQAAVRQRRATLQRERKLEQFDAAWADLMHGARVVLLDDLDNQQPAQASGVPARLVYTDGSYTRRVNARAGWAVVTFAAGCSVADEVENAICGRVETDVTAPGYRGAGKGSNNTAELTALLAAAEQELRRDRPDEAVTFRVDSTYAINISTGKWTVKKVNKALATRLAGAMAALRGGRRRGAIRVEHVRAHKGEIGNEIADGMAKWAAKERATPHALQRARALQRQLHAQGTQRTNPSSSSTSTSSTSSSNPDLAARKGIG